MGGPGKTVSENLVGAAWRKSRRFLFFQRTHRDKSHKVIADMDILPPYAAAVIRGLDIDGLHQFPQGIGGQLIQFRVLAYPLDKLLQIFCLSFLCVNFRL